MEFPETIFCAGTTVPDPSAAVSTRICVAAPTVILNELLTAGISPELDAVIALVPVRLILRSLNVARPDPFVNCEVVPESAPEPEDSVMITDTPEVVTLLPKLSRSCTVTAGVIGEFAGVAVGCWIRTSCAADAGFIVNEELIAEVRPPLDAVMFLEPERLMLKSLKVANPELFVSCVNVPLNTPVPVVRAIVMETPALETSFPAPSRN
jgi:hypothetical protein